jgi:hypothetical protein
MCPHAAIYAVRILLYAGYIAACVAVSFAGLLYICQHTAIYVSAYSYICVRILPCVHILPYARYIAACVAVAFAVLLCLSYISVRILL